MVMMVTVIIMFYLVSNLRNANFSHDEMTFYRDQFKQNKLDSGRIN